MKIKYHYSISICLLILLSSSSCKKFIEIPPPKNSISDQIVFSDDASAVAVVNGIYGGLSNGNLVNTYNFNTSSLWAGLLSDELRLWDGESTNSLLYYYQNSLSIQNGSPDLWYNCYKYIYKCNAVIEALDSNLAETLTPKVRNQLMGEAKFMRATFYFYLVNFYGPVPLVVTTDYKTNSNIPRTSINAIYDQIEKDLSESKLILSKSFLDSKMAITTERTRPSYWAASALLSRVYLFREKWSNAEKESTEMLDNTNMFDVKGLAVSDVFLKNSKEAIEAKRARKRALKNQFWWLSLSRFTIVVDKGE